LWVAIGLAPACWASEGAIDGAALAKPFAVGQVTCSIMGAAAAEPGIAQAREVSCQFRPGLSGAEETYVGTLQGAGQVEALFKTGVIMLLVKQTGSSAATPGMLQQTYSADASTRAGHATPLIGDTNSAVTLQPMIERAPGEATKQATDALLVRVELKLQASVA
jgi:hypothetical protein